MTKTLTGVFWIALGVACVQKHKSPKDQDPETVEGNGVIDGNGGGGLTYKANPWFVGPQAVRYCIERSDDFSLPLERARKVIANVIQDWSRTLPLLIGRNVTSEENPPLVIQGQTVTLSSAFEDAGGCDQPHDLTFKLGSFDAKIDASLRMSQKNLVGLALLTSYDQSTGRGAGEVFIAPDRGSRRYEAASGEFWQDEYKFSDVLLHELGHIFGFKHDQATFMFEGYPALRLASEIKGTLSSATLLNRDLFAIDKPDGALQGDLYYENGGTMADILGEKVAKAALIAPKRNGFPEPIVQFYSTSGAVIAADTRIGSTSKLLLSVEGIYQNQAHSFLSYVDTFDGRGTLTVKDKVYPMTLKLVWSGFEIQVFDTTASRWLEINFRARSIDLAPTN